MFIYPKPYKAGEVFYRCGISTEEGIPIEEMGAPPIDKTTDGRANARGIRCLYLGDTAETTIYEARAGAYDYVTVGKFKLKEDIIVVDLKKINQISPFIEGLDCLEYAINKEHLNKINDEMGKIMRRSDSVLDYVPTQYITDFVKSIIHDDVAEYAAIEYKSVMHSEGYNLALFDPDLFECIDTEVFGIDTIDYRKCSNYVNICPDEVVRAYLLKRLKGRFYREALKLKRQSFQICSQTKERKK